MSPRPNEEARRVFDRAVDAGMNLVDTANVYGNGASETLTGQWIAGKRDRVLLATKCRFYAGAEGPKGPSSWSQGLSRRAILDACDASLKRLGTDFIDLYQVHMQDADVPDRRDAARARRSRASGQGPLRRLLELHRLSRRRSRRIAPRLLGTPRYESIQLQWSLAERGAEREMIPACRAFGTSASWCGRRWRAGS